MKHRGSAQKQQRQGKSADALVPAPIATWARVSPRRLLPLPEVVLVEVLAAVGWFAATSVAWPSWRGALVGAAVALPLVAPIRGRSVPRRIAGRLRFRAGRRARVKDGDAIVPAPFDSVLPDRSSVGMHWDGTVLTSLIRIEASDEALTIMEPGATVSGETVPVTLLTDCLEQFDITVDSIDVISQGSRSLGQDQLAATYDAILGPLPAISHRKVWLAVRLDPCHNEEAIRRRGGDWAGIEHTMATATQRIVNRLADAGVQAGAVSAAGIDETISELADGVDLRTLDERWSTCRWGKFRLRTFAVPPAMLTASGLASLWTVPSYSTTVCVSLRRLDRRDGVAVRALARFDTHNRSRVRPRGLLPLNGRQFDALVSSLPAPAPRRPIHHWGFAAGADVNDRVAGLNIPAAGCGQLVGADEHGRAVAVALFGPRIAQVDLCGTMHLAQQVVLRSLALGARVRVNTRRPLAWQPMVDRVGNWGALHVADLDGADDNEQARGVTVEVFDGVPRHQVRPGVTSMHVEPSHAAPSPDAHASLQLLDPSRDLVRVNTRSASTMVTMVATDDELAFIGASLDAEMDVDDEPMISDNNDDVAAMTRGGW